MKKAQEIGRLKAEEPGWRPKRMSLATRVCHGFPNCPEAMLFFFLSLNVTHHL